MSRVVGLEQVSVPRCATICFLLAVMLCSVPTQAEVIEGRIVKVIDGDTLDVMAADHTRLRLRIAGIDAPEIRQPFGLEARRYLREVALRQRVSVETRKADRNGRKIGVALIAPAETCPKKRSTCPRTLDLGLVQIKAGLAWHYRQYQYEQNATRRLRYVEGERTARALGIGLWSEPNPVPPWQWRHHPHLRAGRNTRPG